MEERSLIVQAKTLEEALTRAAVLLHCSEGQVSFEILQHPVPSRNGRPSVPCKLRASPCVESVTDSDTSRADDDLEIGFSMPALPTGLEGLPCDDFLNALLSATDDVLISLSEVTKPTEKAQTDLREINEDLTLAIGHIDHQGDLKIFGNIAKGVRVHATGRISITGDVDTTLLSSDGDIDIEGGIFGAALSIQGNIRAKFGQGATITAPQGSITIHESAMHCQIHAGHTVTVGDTVVGGVCYGEQLVDVRIAGSAFSAPVSLIAGRNKQISEEIEAIRLRAIRTIAALGSAEAIRAELQSVEERGLALPTEDRVRLWNAVHRKAWLNGLLLKLSRQKAERLGMINQDKSTRVCIKDRAYPKVKIIVDDCPLEIRSVTQFASFSKDYESGKLRVASYQ